MVLTSKSNEARTPSTPKRNSVTTYRVATNGQNLDLVLNILDTSTEEQSRDSGNCTTDPTWQNINKNSAIVH